MAPAMAELDLAPPLNERGMVELVSPLRGLRLVREADEVQYLPNGQSRIVRKADQVRFENSRANVTLEDWEWVKDHPAYQGGPRQPKVVFLAYEHPQIQGADGPSVVDGAISSGTGKRTPPPLPAWDTMTYKAIREALRDGKVRSPVDALIYEREHRGRAGVMHVVAAQIAGVGRLPTVQQMQAVDRKADGPDDDPPPAAQATVSEEIEEMAAELPSDDDVRAAIDAALAPEEGDDDEPGEDTPAPEGVI